MSTEILKHDHDDLARLLGRLQAGFQGSEKEFQVLDHFWARLAMHIRAEHLCLFPAILGAERTRFGVKGAPSFEETEQVIAQLKSDHNFFMGQLAEAVKMFRDILVEPPDPRDLSEKLDSISERVNAVGSRLEHHNVLEEEQVYLWPQFILDPSDLDDLSASMNRELENVPARFNEDR
jgi:hypothetical protein